MTARWLTTLAMTLPLTAPAQAQHLLQPSSTPPPVAAPRPHTVAGPHGSRIDEYHWLRDDDATAKRPEVVAYLEAENAYTARLMAPLEPLQKALTAELRARVVDDDSTPPAYDNGHWYWSEFKPGAEYPLLWRQRGSRRQPDTRAPKQLLLDQPARAAGHAFYKVGASAVSPDGRLLAWTEDVAGRRIHTLRIKHIASGRLLADGVAGVLEDLAWAADSRTLFYIRQDPVTLQSGPVWRHTLGTPAAADVQVFDEADKTQFVGIGNSASRDYVVIHIGGFDTSETRAVPSRRPTEPPRLVLKRQPGVRHVADHFEGRWFLRTNEGAPNFKLVSAPDGAADVRPLWRTLVAGREQATLEGFALFDGGIALQERVDADVRVRLLQHGRSRPVAAAPGTTVALGDNRDPAAAHLRYTATSMVQPQATFDLRLDDAGRAAPLLRKLRSVPGYDAAAYATERLWVAARDGQRVPVTLAYKRGLARADGRAPLLIYGYGAYGASYDPEFSANRISLLDRGFVVALAHVRGGAELGQGWYEQGRLMNKRNTFNDFVDATDGLVAAGWGDPARVFASGGSAGGLLMGVVANEAGLKYRGIVLDVPFVDVVSTMLDESIPLTVNEWTQWGDPRDKAAHDYLLGYSPYDNLAARAYPPMLVLTGLWDSQVQYFEPAKYVARLRARKTDANPLLLHTNMAAGHGGASGRYEALAELAREYAFLLDLAGPSAPPPSAASGHGVAERAADFAATPRRRP